MTTLYQHGTLALLVPGLFTGTQAVGELLKHGDTGIGTLEGLDGELIIMDGIVYQVNAMGQVRVVNADETVPFANVHKAHPQPKIAVEDASSDALKQIVLKELKTENLFAAIRVDGEFSQMHTRAVLPQTKPYPTLAATAEGQHEFNATNIKGTIIGYFSPVIYAGAVAAGFHLHFLSEDHVMGGHILDFDLAKGDLQIETFDNFNLHLPVHDPDFLETKINAKQAMRDIAKAEN